METNVPLDNELPDENLGLNTEIRAFLKETAKWTLLISIIGFIYVGIMIIIGIVMGFSLSSLPLAGTPLPFSMGAFGIIYVIFGLIALIPMLYLFRFSTNMTAALRTNSESALTAAFSNLKSHYKFYGIFIIIVLGFYLLMLLLGLLIGFGSLM